MGTMFNVMANDGGGSPWDKIWTAISGFESKVDSLNVSLTELQERVSTIEAEANQVKTIRFYEPSETIVPPPSGSFKDVATFVWTPNNNTNNAILSIRCYFQYRSDPSSGGLRYRILINDEIVMSFDWLFSSEYKWAPIIADFDSWGGDKQVTYLPNQNNYTIKVQFACETTGYVKDINVIITVADGLPASNP